MRSYAFFEFLSPAVIVALGFVATSSGSLFHLPPLATLGFTTWLFGFLVILCRSIFKRVPQRDLRIFLAGITIFSSLTFATLSTYFTIGVTTHSTLLLLLVMTMALVLLGKNTKPFSVPTLSFHNLLALSGNERLVLAGTIFSQATVLLLLILSRYDGALITPWMIFPPTNFAFFFIGTAGVLALQRQTNTAWIWPACSQTFLAVALSCFVYGVGFGFDPFIHRAAETALINDGFIYPQRFLYSGQYALIGSLHFLARLPINLIDIWILPLLASIFLPWSAYLGLRDGWKLPEPAARFGWALALFIPFMLFTFTVPFTFTYVIYAGALFLAPLTHTRSAGLVMLLLASVSCLFHPLLGARPLFYWPLATYI
ncbi:MAG: hypothetical protein IPG80_03445 [Anaerolineales bacterium]|uniref:hypothetical protein n=1 Tax=Candidatus Villigracilis vicinus TaxID=3140679 RepID=UPI003137024A|nr:hypothetical protein [Anaerolineales bacterium]